MSGIKTRWQMRVVSVTGDLVIERDQLVANQGGINTSYHP